MKKWIILWKLYKLLKVLKFCWKESLKQNNTKEQKGGFLSMLLGTLGATLFGNLLTGKGTIRAGSGNNKGKEIVRAGSGKQLDF